jgi:hypothetical protein
LRISEVLAQKVLTQPKNVVTIAGFASKKGGVIYPNKALRVVRSVDDGSKTDLGGSGNQADGKSRQALNFGVAQDASWEILK